MGAGNSEQRRRVRVKGSCHERRAGCVAASQRRPPRRPVPEGASASGFAPSWARNGFLSKSLRTPRNENNENDLKGYQRLNRGADCCPVTGYEVWVREVVVRWNVGPNGSCTSETRRAIRPSVRIESSINGRGGMRKADI